MSARLRTALDLLAADAATAIDARSLAERAIADDRDHRANRWIAVVAAVLALVLLGLSFLTGTTTARRALPAATGTATIPDAFADWAPGASAAKHPAGRAIAAYGDANPFTPTLALVGAEADTYRSADDPRNVFRLSPDGTHLAVARWHAVAILDLRTGATRILDVDRAVNEISAWSPDGRLITFTDGTALLLLDVRTGRTRVVSGRAEHYGGAAFSPSGDQLAVMENDGDVGVYDLAGRLLRRVDLPPDALLVTHVGWTPDGRTLLATTETDLILAGDASPPRRVPADYQVVGWTGPTTMLVCFADNRIGTVDLRTGQRRELSTLPAAAGLFQVATGLVVGIETRPAGPPDRGVWPWWLVLAVGLLVGVPVVVVGGPVALIYRSRQLRRRG